jgi:hypothetical protein
MRHPYRRPRARSARILGTLLALMSVAAFALPVSASATPSTWHRLNPGVSSPPEHERLICVTTTLDRCRYDKLPHPALGFQWNRTSGVFIGSDASSSWTCPDWFPASICGNLERVSTGTGTFFPQGGSSFSVGQDLIVTELAGQSVLYVHWHDQFVCPWFETFDDALAANPIPLPYDGIHGGAMDCVFR